MATTEIYRYLPVDETTEVGLDPEGYLVDLTQWTPDVARALAGEEGISLDEAHWEVIEVLRDFYARYEMAPAMRPLVKAVGRSLGPDKGRSIHLMRLFPGSLPRWRLAWRGCPNPAIACDMNFLAHGWLARGGSDDFLYGNLIADGVKGVELDAWGEEVAGGIRHHRRVDAYVDAHPVVREARARAPSPQRRYAGIALDLLWIISSLGN